ncbi:ATP-binding protein [Microbacterium marinilacus]|uniref:Sensor histidine kinase n=1 Tax=Microbacterium marinilacus TaxID=415209 RepID=A0ABP7BQR7_9MICO|nr:sensor histidine kinase [Microbacterium marinilacus]MBY0689230.1 GHKL domain-containing protein [Microbacterium marinilacus]
MTGHPALDVVVAAVGSSQALPDIPRAYTALAEWAACLVYILILGRRMGWAGTAAVSAAGLGALMAVQHLAGLLPLTLWLPGMLAAAATMYGLLAATVRGCAVGAGYLTARAFMLAELTASLHWQLDHFYFGTDPGGAVGGADPLRLLLLAVVYAGALAVAWAAERRQFPRGGRADATWRDLGVSLAIAAATFGMSNLSFLAVSTPFSGRLGPEVFYIRTLVDLCGCIALYLQQEQRRETEARRENEAMATLLRGQHDQYRIARRTIEDVDRKYHDMKHHLQAIRAEPDGEARQRIFEALEESVSAYGAHVRTGNRVLDAVVTGKQMYAVEHDVSVSVVADGRLIEFMHVLDVTSLVGNALDNAIEATRRVADRERRAVRMALFAQDDWVMLRFENTYDGILQRDGERILTRKGGAGHGFGLRNIEETAEKYGGSVSIAADDAWFSLRVLLPRR